MEIQLKVQLVLDTYREELARLTNENVLLKAQLKQLQNELEKKEKEGESQQ